MSSKHLLAFISSLLAMLLIGGVITFRDKIFPQGILSGVQSNRQGQNGSIFSPTAVSIGPADAKVTVVEFLDFQCPFCRAAYPTLKQLLSDYRGASVRFVFRHFPLIPIHPLALQASNASLCANEQEKFFPYKDLLYTKQDDLSSAALVGFARELGLNLQQFNECLAEKRHESEIRKDVADGLALGIEGTPTWFVNNIRLVGALPLKIFKETIDKELAK